MRLAALALGGLAAGSFLNVVIHRLPRGESIVWPPSHCPRCGRRLGARELVPVLSFLVQRGRCRGCGEPIPWRYPLVELVTAVLLVAVGLRYPDPAQTAFYGWLTGILIAATFIDVAHRIIPNRLLAAGLIGGAALFPWARPHPLGDALLGIGAAGGVMLLIGLLSRGGMGGGDIKLAAVFGFFLGAAPAALALLLGFTAGGLAALAMLLLGLKGRKDAIPFGPYLAGGAMAALLWGRSLIDWYASQF